MAPKKQTRGACAFCGRQMTGNGMVKHLSACPKRKEILSAQENKPGKKEKSITSRSRMRGSLISGFIWRCVVQQPYKSWTAICAQSGWNVAATSASFLLGVAWVKR